MNIIFKTEYENILKNDWYKNKTKVIEVEDTSVCPEFIVEDLKDKYNFLSFVILYNKDNDTINFVKNTFTHHNGEYKLV